MEVEKTTAELEAEILAAEEAAKKLSEDTTDGGEGTDKTEPGVVKKDYLKMSVEEIQADLAIKYKDLSPEQLVEKMAKQLQIIGHKNRAIDVLKKSKEVIPAERKPEEEKPPVSDDLDKPLTRRDLADINNKNVIDGMINAATSNEAERKAIREAYDSKIVRSGNADEDFVNALAIANRGVVEDYKKNRAIAENNESYLAGFSGGLTYGPPASNAQNDAVKRSVAENLRKTGMTQDKIDEALKKI
jgi:hypothetical protein